MRRPAPAAQQSFLADPSYYRDLHISGRIGDIFDGTTLRQTVLANFVALTSGQFTHRIYAGSGPSGTPLSTLAATFEPGAAIRVGL